VVSCACKISVSCLVLGKALMSGHYAEGGVGRNVLTAGPLPYTETTEGATGDGQLP
jgi:hypothetical protein